MQEVINPRSFYKDRYESRESVSWLTEKIFKEWITTNAIGPRVLDSGCGNGILTGQLTERFNVTGIDISENNLRQAGKLGLKTVRHDFSKKLPFGKEEFDTAVSSQVIEHIYDTDFYLSEIHRVLKKGGVFLITTPNTVSALDRLRVLIGRLPITCEVSLQYKLRTREKPNGHIRPYTFPELKHQLARTGFRVINQRTTNFPFPIYWNLPAFMKKAAISMGAIMPTLGGQIMIKAIKFS